MSVDVYSAFEIGAMTILGNESRRFVDLPEYQRLEADLAKERGRVKELAHQKGALIDRADTYYQKLAAAQEKVKELERRNVGFSELTGLMQTSLEGDTARIGELLDELAAAQATIAQMREALDCLFANEDEKPQYVIKALAISTNLDALHELRALECERLMIMYMDGVPPMYIPAWLESEAAAHRAKKGEGE